MVWARFALVAALVSVGCSKNEEECDAELRNVSALITAGRLDDAQGMLGTELRKRCADTRRLRTVEKQLAEAKATAEAKAKAEIEQRRAGEANLTAMRSFLRWVAERVDAPEKGHDKKECWGAGDPEAGFCEAAIHLNSDFRTITWRETDRSAFRFISEPFPSGPEVTCADFGAQQVRRWFLDGAGVHSHCVLAADIDQRLFQLHLWIKNAKDEQKYLRVFSASYLKVAPYQLANRLESEGKTL